MALLARLIGRVLSRASPAAPVYAPLAICGAALLLCAFLPGKYVWSTKNAYNSLFMAPRTAQNLVKMPADLLPIVRRLAEEPDIDQVRILCGPEVVSFMTPYSRSFRFAHTRPNYTLHLLGLEGRTQEAIERRYLYSALTGALKLTEPDWHFLADHLGKQAVEDCRRTQPQPTPQDFPRLLFRYRVQYVITSPPLDVPPSHRAEYARFRENLLQKAGCEVAYRGKEYVLWKRRTELPPPEAYRGPHD